MKIILLQSHENLGKVGEIVNVKPGFARNFLFPKKMALPVSADKIAFFEHQKRVVEAQKAKLKSESEILKDKIQAEQITIFAKVGKNDKLFGSVGTRDINKAHLMAKGIKAGTIFVNNYDESDLTVPAGGFKQSGIGRDNSYHALDTYLQIKSTWIKLADK